MQAICKQCGGLITEENPAWTLDGFFLHRKVQSGADSCYWLYKRDKRIEKFRLHGQFRRWEHA